MDKNKISLVIFKMTLSVTVAVCLLFALMGLAELYSFKQMVEYDIRVYGYGEIVPSEFGEKFAEVSKQTILLIFIVLCLFALNALHLTKRLSKNEKTVKIVNLFVFAVCVAALIAVMIISILVMHQSFTLADEVPRYSASLENTKQYYAYSYFQTYQSSALSVFLPFLVAAVLTLSMNIQNFILSGKKSNRNRTEKQPLTQTENTDNIQ